MQPADLATVPTTEFRVKARGRKYLLSKRLTISRIALLRGTRDFGTRGPPQQ